MKSKYYLDKYEEGREYEDFASDILYNWRTSNKDI